MTSRPRLLNPRECRERGAALPMALGFLILFSVLIGLVFDYIGSGILANTHLTAQRDDISAANSAINAAVARIQADSTKNLGSTGTACGMPGVDVNGRVVDVSCAPDPNSGQAIPTTAAPPFAILTTAPFTEYWNTHGYGGGSYPGCSSISTAPGAELGLIETQTSKFVSIQGGVYVNSDVDADAWGPPAPPGCPNVFGAAAIQVQGNLIAKESCHDAYATAGVNGWYCDQNGVTDPKTQSDAGGRTPNGAWSAAPAALQANLQDPAIAQPNSWALPFNTAPPVQKVPTCPSGRVVAFDPGTYDDAAALSTLMNGTTCPGRVFWFKPGAYYFNFGNSGSHEWSINDGVARIIGGQPNTVVTGSTAIGPTLWTPSSATSSQFASPDSARVTDTTPATVQLGNIVTGPTTWSAQTATSTSFASPDSAKAIDGTATTAAVACSSCSLPALTATAVSGNNGFPTTPNNAIAIGGGSAGTGNFTTGTKTITLNGYTAANAVPAGATNIQVQAHLVHQEGGANQVGTFQVQVRDSTDSSTLCSFNVTRSTSSANVTLGPTSCAGLTPALLNTGGFRVRYSIAHGSGGSAISTTLDGIELLLSYTGAGSAATLSLSGFSGGAAIPAGASISGLTLTARHNEGTDLTLVNTPTVAISGCSVPGMTKHLSTATPAQQTDTLTLPNSCFSIAALNAGTASLTYSVGHAAGSAAANVALDGITIAVTYSITGISGTATVTLSGFATNPASSIPNDAAITSVRLRVAHGEDNTAVVNNPTVTITPANTAACPPVSISKHASLTEDANPSYDVTSCLDDPAKIDNGVSLTYSVSRCNGCNGGTTARLDGVQLDITYAPNPRLPWDPNDPNANPNVPGACRRDGDPFWSDGVQWVFGGDSRLNVMSGQMELCDKPSLVHADPSLDKQEIVLFGVKGAPPVGPNLWTANTVTNGTPGANLGFETNTDNARTIDNTSATTATPPGFTTGTRSLTLFDFTGIGAPVPPGATNLDVSLTVAHNEGNTSTLRGLLNQPSITITPGGTVGAPPAACTMNVTKSTTNDTNPLSQTFPGLAASCLDTPAKINGATVAYSVAHSATAGTAAPSLDGVTFTIKYAPAGPNGGLNPESGCITQAPYYNPTDHSPAYNGACAVVRVTRPTGTQPPGDVRKVTFWGTVYAPSAAFDLPVDLMSVPVFNRGVVARMLMLGYQVANSTQIPFTTVPLTGGTPVDREATFIATVHGVTKITAHVRFCDTAPCGDKNSVVDSWVVTR